MKLLIELYGIDKAEQTINKLMIEIPNMHSDYYIRNVIRILS
jgi:hypothetical protein